MLKAQWHSERECETDITFYFLLKEDKTLRDKLFKLAKLKCIPFSEFTHSGKILNPSWYCKSLLHFSGDPLQVWLWRFHQQHRTREARHFPAPKETLATTKTTPTYLLGSRCRPVWLESGGSSAKKENKCEANDYTHCMGGLGERLTWLEGGKEDSQEET